jgi:hypothetical protein
VSGANFREAIRARVEERISFLVLLLAVGLVMPALRFLFWLRGDFMHEEQDPRS